jgi:hypothetical protein
MDFSTSALEWMNSEDGHHVGGRRATEPDQDIQAASRHIGVGQRETTSRAVVARNVKGQLCPKLVIATGVRSGRVHHRRAMDNVKMAIGAMADATIAKEAQQLQAHQIFIALGSVVNLE